MTFSKKPLRRANYQVLFFPGNAKFRQGRQVVPYGARSNFYKCQRLAIVTDQIDLALNAAGGVIPCYKYVSVSAQIPVSVCFAAHAGALGFELFFAAGKTPFITQPAPRRPVHCPKHQM